MQVPPTCSRWRGCNNMPKNKNFNNFLTVTADLPVPLRSVKLPIKIKQEKFIRKVNHIQSLWRYTMTGSSLIRLCEPVSIQMMALETVKVLRYCSAYNVINRHHEGNCFQYMRYRLLVAWWGNSA